MRAIRKTRRPASHPAEKFALELKITLAADPLAVDPVVQCVMNTIRSLQCAIGKDDAVELALTEALANAVVHGAKSDDSKIVECDVLCRKGKGIVIVVRDPGDGFDIGKIPSPLKGRNVFADHGRGIFLINQLMDEVKYSKNGAEIRMVKR